MNERNTWDRIKTVITVSHKFLHLMVLGHPVLAEEFNQELKSQNILSET